MRANYLASPPLVVAYALDRHDVRSNLQHGAHRQRQGRQARHAEGHLAAQSIEIAQSRPRDDQRGAVRSAATPTSSGATTYWQEIPVERRPHLRSGWRLVRPTCRTRPTSTACRCDPAPRSTDIVDARILGLFLDLDHHRPHLPGRFDQAMTALPAAISSSIRCGRSTSTHYGSRRGNHEVMMRGTFANIRIKNQMVPGVEGGVTIHQPSRQNSMSIYDAAMRYQGRRRAAGDLRRQGIRHRLLARLGGEGHACCSASAR